MPQVDDNRIPTNYNDPRPQQVQYNNHPSPSQGIREWADDNINPRTFFGFLGLICFIAVVISLAVILYTFCHWMVTDHKMIMHAIVAIIVILNFLIRA